jgi:hypothetical protein
LCLERGWKKNVTRENIFGEVESHKKYSELNIFAMHAAGNSIRENVMFIENKVMFWWERWVVVERRGE